MVLCNFTKHLQRCTGISIFQLSITFRHNENAHQGIVMNIFGYALTQKGIKYPKTRLFKLPVQWI